MDVIFSIMVWTILLLSSLLIIIPMNLLLGIVICVLLAAPAAVTVCGMMVEGMMSLMKRPRVLSHEVTLDGELYMEIAERLRTRGIDNPTRFILDHPHHLDACLRLARSFGWSGDYSARYPTTSLVYTRDDPDGTAETISAILQKRGFLSASDIEELLKIGEEVQTPLREGAL